MRPKSFGLAGRAGGVDRAPAPTRRAFVAGGAAAVLAAQPSVVLALGADAARRHVEETIHAILELIVANKPRAETARRLLRVIRERSALPQLARFVAGSYWTTMDRGQRHRFTEALGEYVAHVYAGYFRRYDGTLETLQSHVVVTGASDAGAKGIVVTSEIRPIKEAAIPIVWLVSDRSGRVAISDLSVAGISMALTQRDILLAMFKARDGDPERMISALVEKTEEAARE